MDGPTTVDSQEGAPNEWTIEKRAQGEMNLLRNLG
jgi:hypothetical protein